MVINKVKMRKYILILSIILILSCDGDFKEGFYESGNKKFEVPVKGGEFHGTYKEYYPDGNLSREAEYRNGKINGITVEYDSTGYKMNIVNYENGLKQGYFEEYFSKTNFIKIRGYYKYNEPDSLGWEYYSSGKIHHIYYYDMGKLIYFKGYDTLGVMSQSKITTQVYPKDTMEYYPISEMHKVYIELNKRYSYGEGNRIWLTTGMLDENDNLLDTLESVFSEANQLFIKYQTLPKNVGENQITGLVHELKTSSREIIGTVPFRYSYKVK